MLQILTRHESAVLCVEGIRSRFAVSGHLFGSGNYEIVVATNIPSALIAFKTIWRIGAAVWQPELKLEEQVRVVADFNAARPGLPQIVVAPPPRVTPPETLNLVFIESVFQINEELQRLLASTRAKSQADREISAELRAESSRVREETKRLRLESAQRRRGQM